MATNSKGEMTVRKLWSDMIWSWIIWGIVFGGTVLGLVNLFTGVAIIGSLIWLVIVAYGFWTAAQNEGGIRRVLVNILGDFAPRDFIQSVFQAGSSSEIRFGFKWFGRDISHLVISVDRIESVEWRTGQASARVGGDLDDWHVAVWYDHCDPDRSLKGAKTSKPDQDVYIVGPTRARKLTDRADAYE